VAVEAKRAMQREIFMMMIIELFVCLFE
jgi:hypothetical protein